MDMQPYTPPVLDIVNSVTVKLTEKNYILWKRQFETFLNGQRLLGFVTGSNPAPVTMLPVPGINGTATLVPNPDYQLWFQTDQVVQSWLLGSFAEDIQSIVIHCHTTHEIWVTLGTHFNKPSSSRLFELQRKIQTTSKLNKTMGDYLREIKNISDQLTSIGNPLDERMKFFAALHGLGQEYEPIKTSIEGSMDLHPALTFDDISSRLKSFDDRLQSYMVSSDPSPHLAFHTDRTSQYPSYGNRGRSSGRRFGRGRGRFFFSTRGRGFHQQLSSYPSSSVSSEQGHRPVCQICGRQGHVAQQRFIFIFKILLLF